MNQGAEALYTWVYRMVIMRSGLASALIPQAITTARRHYGTCCAAATASAHQGLTRAADAPIRLPSRAALSIHALRRATRDHCTTAWRVAAWPSLCAPACVPASAVPCARWNDPRPGLGPARRPPDDVRFPKRIAKAVSDRKFFHGQKFFQRAL